MREVVRQSRYEAANNLRYEIAEMRDSRKKVETRCTMDAKTEVEIDRISRKVGRCDRIVLVRGGSNRKRKVRSKTKIRETVRRDDNVNRSAVRRSS